MTERRYYEARTVRALRETPTDELIRLHDDLAGSSSIGVDYYLDELARREAAEQTKEMLRLTKLIALFTLVVTAATIEWNASAVCTS